MLKMTNRSEIVDHNIFGSRLDRDQVLDRARKTSAKASGESGYSLVALLAFMTLLGLFAMAAAPSLRQQGVREREKEAIFRGEQVADAIRAYYSYRVSVQRVAGDQSLPTSMEQLLEGIPIPGGSKKRQVLRPSAARDPLSIEGEWRLIRPRSQELIDFQQAIIAYSGNVIPPPRDSQMAALQQLAVPQLTAVLNTGTQDSATDADATDESYSGPFVGVASRNKTSSVLYYYDIDHHNRWIFTPLFR
jgi:type II secretory pathway pseudopilin PulG